MGWVTKALKELNAGNTVQIRPQGGSMRGRIESGQLVTLEPVTGTEVVVGDVVLVRWKGNYLLHLVKAIQSGQVLIGNNLGKENGWVSVNDIAAKVVESGHQANEEECV